MSEPPFITPSLIAMNSFLPGFEFGEIMTSGKLGAVYFATQRSLDRQVAIKVFSPALARDRDFWQSFESVANSVAALRHPNLIGFIDSGMVDEMPYIVMEFVPGKSLARSTRGKVIDFGQSMLIVGGICEGIAYAHDNGVIHGNLDTLNILLNSKAEPKIGNFGLSRSVHTGPTADMPGHFPPPEVIENPSSVTEATDVYGIAAIFYELIAGMPYQAGAPAPSAVTSCGPEVDRVLREATHPDPQKRTGDVRKFYRALQDSALAIGRDSSLLVPAEVARNPGSALRQTTVSSKTTHPTAPMSKTDKVGFDSNLIIKLIVIVFLALAVHQLWNYLEETREERDLEAKRILAESKAAREQAIADERERRARELEERKKAIADASPVVPDVPQRVETPMESLDRLRSDLKSGLRSEMPEGSVREGDSDYFLVTEPMTWTDAAAFAEDHGGHLALGGSDTGWMPAGLSKNRPVWIGAARSGSGEVVRIDGKLWEPDAAVSGGGRYVFLDESGNPSTADTDTSHPFVIQWRIDGSNPGSLEARLKVTGASLGGGAPVYPPGTVEFGNRRFLHVARPVTWEQAKEFAELAGGHLLVFSDDEEAGHVRTMTSGLRADDGLWVGGLLEGDHWQWVTGEPWKGAKWIAGANASKTGSAMIIRPGKGWDGLRKDDEASGFFIEWSDDAKNSSGAGDSPAPGSAADELAAKAKELVVDADKARKEALAANIHKLKWDLDAHIRGLKKSENELWSPQAELLKQCVEAERLQPHMIASEEVRTSTYMDRLIAYHTRKQDEIDDEFIKNAAIIRDAFVAKATEIRDEAKASGQIKVEEDLKAKLERASSLESWVKSFGLEYKPKKRVVPDETEF